MRRHLTHTIGTGWPKDGGKHYHFELDFFCGRIHQFPDRFDMFKYLKKGNPGRRAENDGAARTPHPRKARSSPGNFARALFFFSFHELRPFPIRMYALIKGSFTLIRIQRRRSLSFSFLNMCENDRDN